MEPRQEDKHLAKGAEQAKKQSRRKASYDREQVIEEAQGVDKAKRAEKHLAEEPEQLAKEQARKKPHMTESR